MYTRAQCMRVCLLGVDILTRNIRDTHHHEKGQKYRYKNKKHDKKQKHLHI